MRPHRPGPKHPQAGARLQLRPSLRLRALTDRLHDEHRRLDELAVGDLAVRSELALGYAGLAGPVRLALRRMGLLAAEPFAAWMLGSLTDGGDGERVVEQLMAAGLLEPVGLDPTGQLRYRPHDLVALFARELADGEDEEVTRVAHRRLRKLDCAVTLGKLDLADSTYAQARAVIDGVNNAHGVGWLLVHHSRLCLARGDQPAAMADAREALRHMVEAGDPRGVFLANLRLAEALLAGGDAPGAAALLQTLLSTSDVASVPLLKAKAEAVLGQAVAS